MSRFFNTAGLCDPRFHYMIPAVARLPQAPRLVERGGYFVVHAPRQTGKTTTLRALAGQLTAAGKYAALHFSCEVAEVAGDDYVAAQRAILTSIRMDAGLLAEELRPPEPWPEADGLQLLSAGLEAWTQACPRPLVLFFDEIDALRGESLQVVLRQLRAGYHRRPDAAPWSVALCGLRDVRDYTAASGGDANRLGTSSPFNIKIESLRLGNFSNDEVAALYAQHTEDTGQAFSPEATELAYALTGGQPWLVNALAYEIVDKMCVAPPEPITPAHVEQAKEALILARATHLDSLVARLTEARVRPIIEPLLAGATPTSITYNDDAAYVRDLGLIAEKAPVRIANPIYREVIVRVLATMAEDHVEVTADLCLQPDGRLDMRKVLERFVDFWRTHGEALTGSMVYHEVAPQLVFMGFLQGIVNGRGFIDREYGIGRGRIDLLIRWPYTGDRGELTWQREAVEIKVWREKKADPITAGLEQLDGYLETLALDRGVLVIFDRRGQAPAIAERIRLEDAETSSSRPVTVLRV